MKLKCRISGHDWNHGICTRCGVSIAFVRDRLGCRKKPLCGGNHLWTGCRCAKCGEQRPPEWDDIVNEERGGKCVFRYQA